jgi:hypothetical protein
MTLKEEFMGYYTWHMLHIMAADNSAEHQRKFEIIARLREVNENAAYSFDEEDGTLS